MQALMVGWEKGGGRGHSAPGWRVSDCGQAPHPYQGSRKSKLPVRIAATKDPQLLLEGILGRGVGQEEREGEPLLCLDSYPIAEGWMRACNRAEWGTRKTFPRTDRGPDGTQFHGCQSPPAVYDFLSTVLRLIFLHFYIFYYLKQMMC